MKRFGLFRALACVLMAMSLLLCACSGEGSETSSASSTPTVGKKEQMETALGKGTELLSKAENLFGAPVFSMLATARGNGLVKSVLAVNQLSVNGTGHIGKHPLILLREEQIADGVTHTVGTLSAAGDTIHFKSMDGPDGRYVSLLQIEGGNFALTEDTDNRLETGLQALWSDMQSRLTEEQISATKKDGGTEYSATVEADEGFTFALSVFATDNSFCVSAVRQDASGGLLQSSFTLSKAGNTLSFEQKNARNGKPFLEASGTVAVTRKSMTVKGSVFENGMQTEFDLDLIAKSARKVMLEGTVTIPFSNSTVSAQLSGELTQEDEKLLLSAALQASLPGVLAFDLSYESAYTAGKTEIPRDFEGLELKETDANGLVDSLRETYSHAAALYDALFRKEKPPLQQVSSVTYRDEEGSLVLTLYGDGTVGLSLQGKYSMANGILSLSYKEHTLFSVPYSSNENNTYTIWNTIFTRYDDGTVAYLSPGSSNWMELIPIPGDDKLALFDLCLPATVSDNTLKILLPNGSILPLPYVSDSDELSALLWDIPLKYVIGES